MLLYPIHLENLSFAVEKTIGFNLDGVYVPTIVLQTQP
jgi:hypothetical protein